MSAITREQIFSNSYIMFNETNPQIIESNKKLKSAGVIFYDNIMNFVSTNNTFFTNSNIFL